MSVTMKQPTGQLKAIEEARDFLAPKLGLDPEIGIILGTGLGQFASAMKGSTSIAYGDIPNFPVASVQTHAGELVAGSLSGRPTAVMNGRAHFYEGYSMRDVTFPVRVLRALGVRILIVTNAAGGMNPLYEAGDIVLTVDHINLMGDNPLLGVNEDTLGPRFPDMSEPYDRELIALARETAREEKIPLREGVFAGVAGPNLETRAEYRFLRWAGADLVGMSLVPETIVAVHGGMRVLAFAVVTDTCFPDALEPIDVPKTLATAAKAEPVLTRLVTQVIKRLPPPATEPR
ncbi:MAG TPA: purine-nucleoside phosphorylase [Candidatus Limnocylindrales bacterium]|nr:purine-nucleoside phosphorylase [Candidatus Limnocylindrales bacterium]